MVRWRDILDDPDSAIAHPLLVQAVEHVAHYQIRNRGTVGGSLAHADPAAELPGIAVTCEAKIAVIGKAGERVIAAKDFFRGPLTTALSPTKSLPKSAFRRGRGSAASVSANLPAAAATLRWRARRCFTTKTAAKRRNVHVGAIGVADRPLRLVAVEEALDGNAIDEAAIAKAEAAASAAVDPPDDIHATGAYRKALIGVMVERALRSALA